MIALLVLLACAPDDKDTAERGCEAVDCDTGADTATTTPTLQRVAYDCDGDNCSWLLYSDGDIGSAEIDMIQNGAEEWSVEECGRPDTPHAKDLDCGVWHEYHTAFARTDYSNEFEGDTFAITLDALTSDECGDGCWSEQRTDESTLFDMSDAAFQSTVTVRVVLYDVAGAEATCGVQGFAVEYYGLSCTNDLGEF